jgi:hypothetical protein
MPEGCSLDDKLAGAEGDQVLLQLQTLQPFSLWLYVVRWKQTDKFTVCGTLILFKLLHTKRYHRHFR